MAIGEDLRMARLKQGLTQAELGARLDVTQGLVSQWETGRQTPNPNYIEAAVRILGPLANKEVSEGTVFGAWLRSAREVARMTQSELSVASGVSLAQIYNLESGRSTNPQESTKIRLERALQVDVPQEVADEAREDSSIEGIGQLVGFDPYEQADLPTVAGVYVFYDVSDRPVYVGKANAINRRVREHNDKFWFKRPIVDAAAYIEIQDEDLRHQIEQILIKFLKSNAVLNRQSVDR